MTLNEYINQLAKLAIKHGDKEVAYSSDDEGNSFHMVHYSPSVQSVEIGYGDEQTVVVVN